MTDAAVHVLDRIAASKDRSVAISTRIEAVARRARQPPLPSLYHVAFLLLFHLTARPPISMPMMLVDGALTKDSLIHTVTSTVFELDGSNSSRNAPTNHDSIPLRSNLGLQVSSLLTDHHHRYILTHVFM
jgi:hypothetical protein